MASKCWSTSLTLLTSESIIFVRLSTISKTHAKADDSPCPSGAVGASNLSNCSMKKGLYLILFVLNSNGMQTPLKRKAGVGLFAFERELSDELIDELEEETTLGVEVLLLLTIDAIRL